MDGWKLLLLTALCVVQSGCAWWKARIHAPQAPTAFTGPVTLEHIAAHLNQNPVRQLEAERAKISLSGLPKLSARLALERPRNLRFRVETGWTGAELDAGSNAEGFWFWARQNDPPAVYVARHDQFAGSTARRVVPIQPEWIAEALGLVYFDPRGRHEGPIDRGNHRLEVISYLPAPDGELKRVMVVNDVYGWVLEQHLYDTRGELLASAKTSEHRYYPAEGASLPHRVEIQLPPAQISFALEVGQYHINQLSASPEQLFTRPTLEGYPLVDIAAPNFVPPGGVPAGYVVPEPRAPRTSNLPNVRGMER